MEFDEQLDIRLLTAHLTQMVRENASGDNYGCKRVAGSSPAVGERSVDLSLGYRGLSDEDSVLDKGAS